MNRFEYVKIYKKNNIVLENAVAQYYNTYTLVLGRALCGTNA